jgi:hypothetical protein
MDAARFADYDAMLRAGCGDVPDLLAQLLERPAWQQHASCRGDLGFFDLKPAQQRPTCQACPVRVECVEYAVAGGEVGSWGATTTKDRTAWRRMTATAAVPLTAWLAHLDAQVELRRSA